jgi:hypothetical protein
MSSPGGAFAASSGISAISGAGNTYASVVSQQIEADYKRQQLEFSRQMADAQAADAITRGDRAAAEERTKTKGLIGSQRVALAAQGLNIEGGSALDVQLDTAAQSAAAELTIKNNAWREAFGYRAQAMAYGQQGAMVGIAARNNITQTILTGGSNFAAGLNQNALSLGLYKKSPDTVSSPATPRTTGSSGGATPRNVYIGR